MKKLIACTVLMTGALLAFGLTTAAANPSHDQLAARPVIPENNRTLAATDLAPLPAFELASKVSIPGNGRSKVSIPGNGRSKVSIPGNGRSKVSIPGNGRSKVSIPGNGLILA